MPESAAPPQLDFDAAHLQRLIESEIRLREAAIDVFGSLGLNPLRDLSFQTADLASAGQGLGGIAPPWYQQNQRIGEALPVYRTEQELRDIRDRSRIMAAYNEFAICGVENRINYVVGDGFKYTASPKDASSAAQRKSAECVQAVLDGWVELNNSAELEAEALWRLDVEGEAFLRVFPDSKGWHHVRFVEPEHVKSPIGDNTDPANTFGVATDRDDVQTVKGYWIVEEPLVSTDPKKIDCDRVLHLKLNTRGTAKRGLPTYFPVEANLRRCEDLLASMTSMAKARAKIALIRKVTGLTTPTANALLDKLTSIRATDPATSETLNVERLRYGTVLTSSGNTEYQFPAIQLGAADIVEVLQAELRAIASRLQMPEWMFTALADAKYNNAFIVEAPTLKSFRRLQRLLRNGFGLSRYGHREALIWRQLKHAVECGLLCDADLKNVSVGCEGPTLEARDRMQEVTRHKELVEGGFESKETAQRSLELDPDIERPLIARERAGTPRKDTPAGEVTSIQEAFYAGKLPREAAGATLVSVFGFSRDEADALLPAVECVKRTDDGQPPPGAPDPGAGPDGMPSDPNVPVDPNAPDAPPGADLQDGSNGTGDDPGAMNDVAAEAMAALGMAPDQITEQLREAGKSGVFTDGRGHRYRLQDGKRVSLGADGGVKAGYRGAPDLGTPEPGRKQNAPRASRVMTPDAPAKRPATSPGTARAPAPAPSAADVASAKSRVTKPGAKPAETDADRVAWDSVAPKVSDHAKTAAPKLAAKHASPAAKATLAAADRWADSVAAKHASRVAAHLGITEQQARHVLSQAIRILAKHATEHGSAKGTVTVGGQSLKVGLKAREGFDPDERRDADGKFTGGGGGGKAEAPKHPVQAPRKAVEELRDWSMSHARRRVMPTRAQFAKWHADQRAKGNHATPNQYAAAMGREDFEDWASSHLRDDGTDIDAGPPTQPDSVPGKPMSRLVPADDYDAHAAATAAITLHAENGGEFTAVPFKQPGGQWVWQVYHTTYVPPSGAVRKSAAGEPVGRIGNGILEEPDGKPKAVNPEVLHVIQGGNLAADEADWRPNETIPEDFYAEQDAAPSPRPVTGLTGAFAVKFLPYKERLLKLREAGFSGVVTASNGVTYHYVDGKRVSAQEHADHVTGGGKPSPTIKNPNPKQFAALIHLIGEHVAKGEADWQDATKAIDKVLKKYGGGVAEWQKLGDEFGFDAGGKKSQSAMLQAIKAHLEAGNTDPAAVAAAKGEDPAAQPELTAPAVQPAPTAQPSSEGSDPAEIAAEIESYIKAANLSAAEKSHLVKQTLSAAISDGHDGVAILAKALGVPESDIEIANAAQQIDAAIAAHTPAQPPESTPAMPAEPPAEPPAQTPAPAPAPAGGAADYSNVELGSPDGYKPAGFDPAAAPKKDYAGKTPQQIDPTWTVNPNPQKQAYGGVVVRTDPATGKMQVLLRKPTGNFDGYVWTWPKGKMADGATTHPDAQTTALAEVAEETGHTGEVIDHIPGVFKSDGSTTNAFFLMKSAGHDPGLMDSETEQTQWIDLDKAHELIGQTTKPLGKKRDLDILAAVRTKLGASQDDPQIVDAARDLAATGHQLAESGSPPDEVAATIKQKLSGFHPQAVAQIAAKIVPGGQSKDLIPHAIAFTESAKGLPQLANLTQVQPIGEGSTGAKVGKKDGKKFAIKDGGAAQHGQEQVRNEVAADAIYKLLGANVPASKLESKGGKKHKVAAWVDGQKLGDYLAGATPAQADAVKQELQKHFVATALLGNWDVVGLNKDNVVVSPDGTPHLIDNGGSFDISANATKKGAAQGKPFGDTVPELDTLLNAGTNPQAASVFGGISKPAIKQQIAAAVAKKQQILAATPPAHKATMEKRLDYLASWAAADGDPVAGAIAGLAHGSYVPSHVQSQIQKPSLFHTGTLPSEKGYLVGAAVNKSSSDKNLPAEIHDSTKTWKSTVNADPVMKEAIQDYTGSDYGPLNRALREGQPLTAAQQQTYDGLLKAWDASPDWHPPLVTYRGVKLTEDAHNALRALIVEGLQNGHKLQMDGFQSTSLNLHTAHDFGSAIGGGSHRATMFEVITHKGPYVGYDNKGKAISSVGHESEVIQPSGTVYKILGIKKVKSVGEYGNIIEHEVFRLEQIPGEHKNPQTVVKKMAPTGPGQANKIVEQEQATPAAPDAPRTAPEDGATPAPDGTSIDDEKPPSGWSAMSDAANAGLAGIKVVK